LPTSIVRLAQSVSGTTMTEAATMSSRYRWVVYCVALIALTSAGRPAAQQFHYWSGQNVVPVFEGWERNSDGSVSMVVGYLNRNVEETIDVPIGPDNNIQPGAPDQGQPTFFAPGRHKYVFRVRVPKDFGKTQRIVWSLTVRGKTEKANFFLLPEWETNTQVFGQNAANGLGGGSYGATLPTISVGESVQSVTLPARATLRGTVNPAKRPQAEPGTSEASRATNRARNRTQRIEWLQFRGPVGGRVTFDPGTPVVTENKAVTTASFNMPGTYVVRAFAAEGAEPTDVTLNVVAPR
jgi:hypothetical protein